MALRVYRRDLPHWRLDAATYWVTWNLKRGQPPLRPAARDAVAAVLRHFDGVQFDLQAFVVMDDHVHILVTAAPGVALEKIVRSWKSVSAWRLHVLNNPRRRWPGVTSYKWVWARGVEPEDG